MFRLSSYPNYDRKKASYTLMDKQLHFWILSPKTLWQLLRG